MVDKNLHLNVYLDHCELVSNGKTIVFLEGPQDSETIARYEKISASFQSGFYDKAYKDVSTVLAKDLLTENEKAVIKNLMDGVTSEVGRALVGLSCLQLAIKCVEPEQCIRLHKGGGRSNTFSWQKGISMRTLDSTFNTPFLRKYNLLSINKYGIMMTRSLAENYPYSYVYKAELRGPVDAWLDLVEELENGSMDFYSGFCYLISLLRNRSNNFSKQSEDLINSISDNHFSFSDNEEKLFSFVENTNYSARAFEVVMHGLFQALDEKGLLDGTLVPLSQMRSANKKHGNVGDIETREGNFVNQSWDAKFGKPYLRDELDELDDKLEENPNVAVCGFVVDGTPKIDTDIQNRISDIDVVRHCDVQILSFHDWVQRNVSSVPVSDLDSFGQLWVKDVCESFCQKRTKIAPIDEPCGEWVSDLISIFGK